MSKALRVLQGDFGRVALLNMNRPLVTHAHHHCHILFKSTGADASFNVDGKLNPLTNESAVLVNAWEPHNYNHNPEAPPTEVLALYLEPSWLAYTDPIFAASNHRNFFPDSCVRLDVELQNKVAQISREMAEGALSNVFDVQQRVFDLTVSVAHRFANWRDIGINRESKHVIYDYRIRRSIQHMRNHIDYRLSIDDLAQVAGLSRPRYYELFRDCTGLTPNLFGSMLVIERSIDHLVNTEGTISDVAYDLGFSTQSNFARFFAQHVGCSPSDYRRKVDLLNAS